MKRHARLSDTQIGTNGENLAVVELTYVAEEAQRMSRAIDEAAAFEAALKRRLGKTAGVVDISRAPHNKTMVIVTIDTARLRKVRARVRRMGPRNEIRQLLLPELQ